VLVADDRRSIRVDVAAIRNDQDVNTIADVILPRIEKRARCYLPIDFLADFPSDALGGVLAKL
jgi:hypothetical protein